MNDSANILKVRDSYNSPLAKYPVQLEKGLCYMTFNLNQPMNGFIFKSPSNCNSEKYTIREG